jgi:hypothetical protein
MELNPLTVTAYNAGYLLAKNNPMFANRIRPVLPLIKNKIDSAMTKDHVNKLFQRLAMNLFHTLSGSQQRMGPYVRGAYLDALDEIGFDPYDEKHDFIDIGLIRLVVDSFVDGITATPVR